MRVWTNYSHLAMLAERSCLTWDQKADKEIRLTCFYCVICYPGGRT